MFSRFFEIYFFIRELFFLIEFDEINLNVDLDIIFIVISLGASSYRSGKRGLFQRVRRVDSLVDVYDFDVLLIFLRLFLDFRVSFVGLYISLRLIRFVNGIIVVEDVGFEGGLFRGYFGGFRVSLFFRVF